MPVLTDEGAWAPACVLCAAREPSVLTGLLHGHCCAPCRDRLRRQMSDVLRLAADAAAFVVPRSGGASSGSASHGSRPPIELAAVDPENTLVPRFPGDEHPTTVLEILECVEREIRDARGLAPYGMASEQRAALGQATLTGVVRFLASQLEWITTSTAFGLEDFAVSLGDCVRALSRWDANRDLSGSRYRVPCPAPTAVEDEDGGIGFATCGRPLLVDGTLTTWCRGCGTAWETARLLAVAGADADIWLDAEAVSEHLGIPERTIRHWGRTGRVERRGMLYRLADITRRHAGERHA